MDILYLLIPLSVVAILALVGLLAWALQSGQFDDLEHQGELVLDPEEAEEHARKLREAQKQPESLSENNSKKGPPTST